MRGRSYGHPDRGTIAPVIIAIIATIETKGLIGDISTFVLSSEGWEHFRRFGLHRAHGAGSHPESSASFLNCIVRI